MLRILHVQYYAYIMHVKATGVIAPFSALALMVGWQDVTVLIRSPIFSCV